MALVLMHIHTSNNFKYSPILDSTSNRPQHFNKYSNNTLKHTIKNIAKGILQPGVIIGEPFQVPQRIFIF